MRFVLAALIGLAGLGSARAQDAAPYDSLADWGAALFFDADLSAARTQSCATCHDPARGFSDPRPGAVSLGDDGESRGARNAPALGYAKFAPPFHRDETGAYIGGQFHDGRARDLEAQAIGPMMNPVEMALSGPEQVAQRVLEKPRYRASLAVLGGADPSDPEAVAALTAKAIAAFESEPQFSSFDSKYDRFLRGEAELSDQEELGRLLFFSQQFTSCNACHQLRETPGAANETFTNYAYHNIGVPANPDLLRAGQAPDRGLLDNPEISDPALAGKFKVPSLRNVALTGPYMHNGVFSDLRTVLLFYNSFNSNRAERQINPETGQPFGPPETPGTLSRAELERGPALNDQRIAALEAFLRSLTDQRYEGLLSE
ncbi:methylamine utilization protein MauG [Thioclava sp. BHET1]|nr:methylamine utilization protein MauG [Thioclava sp. BHET1]